MLSSRKRLFCNVLATSILLITWDLVVRFNIIDPHNIAYPSGMFQVLMKPAFILRFILSLLLATVAPLISGLITIKIVSKFVSQTTALKRLLKARWFTPLFLGWALPFWPLQAEARSHPFVWTLVVATASLTFFLAYSTIQDRNTTRVMDNRDIQFKIWHSTIHYALFLSIVIQPWVVPYSWLLFSPKETSLRPSVLATAVLLYGVLSWILKLSFGANFEREVSIHGQSIKHELEEDRSDSRWLVMLSVFVGVLIWEVLASTGFKTYLSGPIDVAKSVWFHLFLGIPLTYWNHPMIEELSSSIVKVFVGLSAGTALVQIFLAQVSARKVYREWFYYGRYYIALLALNLVYFIGFHDFWITVLVISLVVLYPMLKIFWGFRDYPWICRFFLSVRTVLPCAFVTLIFAESINATQGIGLLVIYANAGFYINDALAGILVWYFILQILLFTINHLVERNWNIWSMASHQTPNSPE